MLNRKMIMSAISIAVLAVSMPVMAAEPETAEEALTEGEAEPEEPDYEEGSVTDKSAAEAEGDVQGLEAWQDGDRIVIRYRTRHASPWDYCYQANPITIAYEDGTEGQIVFDWDGNGIHGRNWSDIPGYDIEKNAENDDTETAVISIPSTWFDSLGFTLRGGGLETMLNGSEPEKEIYEPVYEGITIDGRYHDWDAVEKSSLIEPDGDHNVESVAWVIEDDFIYLYIKDSGTGSAAWAGPAHNGKYAITTDLGRTLLLQLGNDGMVTGADGTYRKPVGGGDTRLTDPSEPWRAEFRAVPLRAEP